MEIQKFVSSYNGLDFESKKVALLSTQRVEVSRLEHTFLEDCDKLEATINANLEAQHACDKIAIREKHYQVSPV